MIRLRSTAAAAAAGIVVAILLGVSASPARASAPPVITVESPAANAVLTDAATISGQVSMPGTLDAVGTIAVSLSAPNGAPSPCDPCNTEHGHQVRFSWSPSLQYNGPYQARVRATGREFLVGVLDGESAAETAVSFQMEVKPAEPQGVSAAVNPDQTVTVSWSRNSEPDMIGYRVQRKDPGSSVFKDVSGPIAQPAEGSTVSIVDPGVTQGSGAFVYRVQAIRIGRSGDSGTAVGSGFTGTEVQLSFVAPPAGTPGEGPPGPGGDPASTPNLSAFLRGGGAAPKASRPGTVSIPDGGFEENLPFLVPPGGQTGGNREIAIETQSSNPAGRPVLVPLAGGLLLCVAAFHLRRFNGWLGREAVLADEPAPPRMAAATALSPLSFNGPSVADVAPPPAVKRPEPASSISFEDWLAGSRSAGSATSADDEKKWAPSTDPDHYGSQEQGKTRLLIPTTTTVPVDKDWEDIFAVKGGASGR